jgi:hypothetical protein
MWRGPASTGGRYNEPVSTHAAEDFPTMSPAERALRIDAVRQADASNRLEGGITNPERKALNEQYTSGRIDLNTYIDHSLRLARQAGIRAATNPL